MACRSRHAAHGRVSTLLGLGPGLGLGSGLGSGSGLGLGLGYGYGRVGTLRHGSFSLRLPSSA